MPLEFLRRKGGGPKATKDAAPEPPPPAIPEEAVAEDHQLRLNFGAKTSNGVRLQGGPALLAALPGMLSGIAKSLVEVVEPRAAFGDELMTRARLLDVDWMFVCR